MNKFFLFTESRPLTAASKKDFWPLDEDAQTTIQALRSTIVKTSKNSVLAKTVNAPTHKPTKSIVKPFVLSMQDVVDKLHLEIRAKKKPEPYKGKGYHYHDEVVLRKQGKKAI